MKKATTFAMGLVLGIAFLAFSRSIGWAINKGFTFTLLSYYTDSSLIKGIVLAVEGFMGLIVPPLVGWYSDRIFTRAGRRKPFIIVGGFLAGFSLYMAYLLYSWGFAFEFFIFMISFFYFSMHLYTAPFRALMPDLIGFGERGKASGIITLLEVIGSLTGFILGSFLWDMDMSYPFIMGAILIPLASVVTYTTIQERPLLEHQKRRVLEEGILEYAIKMFRETDTIKFYTAQTFWWMGFEFIGMFFVGIAAQILLGEPTEENIHAITGTAVLLMGIFNIAAMFSALPGGIIYDKIGRKKAIIIGDAIFGISILTGLLATEYIHILIILIIAGLGWGMLLAASYPVIGDLLTKFKREEYNGRYYGVFEASRSLPIILGGIIGGAIVMLSGNDYRSLFPASAVIVLLAIPLIMWMRHLEG
jgi:MFS family permease